MNSEMFVQMVIDTMFVCITDSWEEDTTGSVPLTIINNKVEEEN